MEGSVLTEPSTPSSYCPTPDMGSEISMRMARTMRSVTLPDARSAEELSTTPVEKRPQPPHAATMHHKIHFNFAASGELVCRG